ncbi:hypothetical protein OAV88_02400 [bacterium]|nr:hypothetical protein [bacterium]
MEHSVSLSLSLPEHARTLTHSSHRERMSFDLQQRLEGQVTSQKMRIEELEEEIAQKSQLLDILKSGLKTYKSYGARKPSKTQREMDFMFMSGKNPPSLPATKVRALVFDCGTSETKALLYTYTNNSKGCDISLEEVYLDNEAKGTKRPGVIEAIESGTIDDVVETFSNLYLQATKSDGKSKTHEMTGLDFCIVGASAWARKLYTNLKVNQDKNILLYELRENGLFPKIFPQSDESAFELLATLLAFTSGKKVGMIPMDFVFSGVLGSGGGSCQYTMRDEKGSYQSLLVEIGNREGRDTFIKSAKSNFKKDPKKSLKDLEDWVRDMKGKIELRKKEASKKFTFRKVKGFVLCISAQYYAAGEMCKVLKGCKETYGNFCNKDNKTETISAGLAVQAAEKYLKQQKKRWLEMSVSEREALVSDKKKLKNFALGLANVSICSTFWSLYFENSAVLCFKRDWEIGGAKYRNTWSAGWFIDILRAQSMFDGSFLSLSLSFYIYLTLTHSLTHTHTHQQKIST